MLVLRSNFKVVKLRGGIISKKTGKREEQEVRARKSGNETGESGAVLKPAPALSSGERAWRAGVCVFLCHTVIGGAPGTAMPTGKCC